MKNNMQKVALISCSKSKRSYPCQARLLYNPSSLFRKSLAYAQIIADDVYVLSAKYGLLSLDQVIAPYDETLKEKSAEEKNIWAVQVTRQIRSKYEIADTEFIILAGKDYYLTLRQHLAHVKLPLAGLSMGKRLSKLDQLIACPDQEQTMCHKLHAQFNRLPRFYWNTIDDVPFDDGIYIVFQEGEKYHNFDRVVRIGTHRAEGRLKGRLKDHFLRENKDGSIFRKNIGRALLNLNQHHYLQAWNQDTSKAGVVEQMGSAYNPSFQKEVERRISIFLRERFSFVCIPVADIYERQRLEEGIIATFNSTPDFGPSRNWSGKYSPESEIRQSGMWLKEGLYGTPLSENEFSKIESYCTDSKLVSDKPKKPEACRSENVCVAKTVKNAGNGKAEVLWYKITDRLGQGSYDLQTVMLNGRKNKWLTASALNNCIIINRSENGTPSIRLNAPRIIAKDEFISLYPNYYGWRNGSLTRTEANEGSQNSSYIFALINEFDNIK